MRDWQKSFLKRQIEEYAIVSVVRCTFLNSETSTQGESHNFMEIVMYLPNLCVYQFLLYSGADWQDPLICTHILFLGSFYL